MYGNLQEIYKNIVFQILKIYKVFSIFDNDLRIGKNTLDCAIVWK